MLDQWRAYGVDGNGYSIGINPHDLKHKVKGPITISYENDGISFIRVNYNENEQKQMLENILDEAEMIINREYNGKDGKHSAFLPIAAKSLSSILWQFTLFYKHSAFENEKEWRVVKKISGRKNLDFINSKAVEGVSFRTSRNSLVPYLELDFTKSGSDTLLPLKEIYLGPKLKNPEFKESLEMYLLSLGYLEEDFPKISSSAIPYK